MVYYMPSLRTVAAFTHLVLRTMQWVRYYFSFYFMMGYFEEGHCEAHPWCNVPSVVYFRGTRCGHAEQNPHALPPGPNTVGHRSSVIFPGSHS